MRFVCMRCTWKMMCVVKFLTCTAAELKCCCLKSCQVSLTDIFSGYWCQIDVLDGQRWLGDPLRYKVKLRNKVHDFRIFQNKSHQFLMMWCRLLWGAADQALIYFTMYIYRLERIQQVSFIWLLLMYTGPYADFYKYRGPKMEIGRGFGGMLPEKI